MTLHEIIAKRSELPAEEEVKAWVSDRKRAEAVYLSTVNLCWERIEAAWQRMDVNRHE